MILQMRNKVLLGEIALDEAEIFISGSLSPKRMGKFQVPDNETFFHTVNTHGLDGGSNGRKALKKRLFNSPTATNANQGINSMNGQGKPLLAMQAHNWPTPCSRDWKDSLSKDKAINQVKKRQSPGLGLLASASGDNLNPDWVELLMGWPVGWTRLTNINEIKNDLTQWNDEWEMDVPRTTKENNGRANRLKCIGNGQVPICAATAFKILLSRLTKL